MTERKANMRMKKFLELDAQIKELKAEQDKIKKELIEEADMADGVISTNKFICTTSVTSTSRFDSTAFKKVHKKLYAEFTKISERRNFKVKEIA